jgi:hypothetical protein
MGKKFKTALKIYLSFWAFGFSAASNQGAGTFVSAVANIGRSLAYRSLVNAVISSFSGSSRGNPPPLNVTVRGTVEFRRLIFGTRRAGGVLVFYGVSGTDNKYLWYVIAYAGHQSSAFSDFWLDERRIPNANIPGGSGGTVTASPWNSKLQIFKHLGTSGQTVDTNLSGAFGAWDGVHRLRGTTYGVIRMERDETVWPDGAPQSATALLNGLLTYDARLDSTNGGSGSQRASDPSTWAFSRDPVQHVRWFLTGGSVHNDVSTRLILYGLRELDSRIDEPYAIASSNVCDQTLSGANAPPSGSQSRYRCDLEVSCSETRRDILKAILASMAGTLTYVHGKWRINAGAYDAPAHTFTEADLYGDLEVQDTIGHDARYNAVAPIFIDAGSQYLQTTGIYRTDSSYETQDGGERIPTELQLDAVTDQYQAQRLAEIYLRRSRMMRGVKLVGALNLMKVALHEVIQQSHARYGWVNRKFRCKEKQLELPEDAGRVTIVAQLEDSGVYTDLLTADYNTGTSNTDLFEDDGLRLSLGVDESEQTFTGVTISAVRFTPDGFAHNDTLASIFYTPRIDTTIQISATFTVSYTTGGSLPYVDFFSSIQDATFDTAKRQEWFDKVAAVGDQRIQTITLTRRFIATGGAAVTYKLVACKFDGGDTVTISSGSMVLAARR